MDWVSELARITNDEPDNVEPFLVYADELQRAGDPRGELIAIQYANRDGEKIRGELTHEFVKEHALELMGPELAQYLGVSLHVGWRLGFADSVYLDDVGVAGELLLQRLDAFRLVRDLVFTVDTTPGDEHVSRLDTFLCLRSLGLSLEEVREAGIAAIAGLPQLRQLSVSDAKRGQLTPLRASTSIRDLSVTHSEIRDEDVAALTEKMNLTELFLRCLPVTSLSIEYAARCPELRSLKIAGEPQDVAIGDKELAPLFSRPMAAVDLHGCDAVTNEGLRQLLGIPTMRRLYLSAGPSSTDDYKTLDDSSARMARELYEGEQADQNELEVHLCALEQLTPDAGEIIAAHPRLVTSYLLHNSWVDGAVISALAGSDTLRNLQVPVCRGVDDDALALLRGRPLVHVDVGSCGPITDNGMPHLAAIATLEVLDLGSSTEITGAGLGALAGHTALRQLDLSFSRFTQDCADALVGLELTHVSLSYTEADDAALITLCQIPTLTHVRIGNNAITNEGFVALAQLELLEELSAINLTQVTDEGLAVLRDHPNLKDLNVSGMGITDESVPVLISLKKLEMLDLADTALSKEALRVIREALPDCYVYLSDEF